MNGLFPESLHDAIVQHLRTANPYWRFTESTWAEREAAAIENARLRNRWRRLVRRASFRVMNVRYAIAHAIYPFQEGE